MAVADVDWLDKAMTWGATLVAGIASYIAKKAHNHIQRVEALEKAVALIEANHQERKAALINLDSRVETHVKETREGFAQTREHIDTVTTSMKDDIREVLRAVLNK